MYDRRNFLKQLGIGLTGLVVPGCYTGLGVGPIAVAGGKRPDIVLIMADDLGYSDLGCYGGDIDTPVLNSLAANGLRFTQFYNTARCCPSRSSLLTGLYPHQAGIGHMSYDAGEPGYRGTLSKKSVTLAEVLRAGGYQTRMCGKWHVARSPLTKDNFDNWPCQRGFEKFYGTLPGHGSFWEPFGLVRDNNFIKPNKKDYFYTDALADNAVNYIRQADADKPLFLYTAFTAPHYPLHARQKTIDKYAGRYDCGWDKLREQRIKRMKKLRILPADYKAPPRDPASIAWEQEKNKKWQAQRMQTYAAMVDEMDQAIGRIVGELKKSRNLDNTLLIFLSDNGASCEGHLNNTAERLGTPWKSKMIPKTTPDGKPVIPGDIPGMPLGGAHTYGSYGLRWASVSNTPFRRHKSWVHEGGISAPFIVHWPNRIKDIGAIRRDVAHIMDFMPTFTEVAGNRYPSTFNGNKIQPMQGTSLLPAIDNKPLKRDYICWEHEGNRAIRQGRWKLVSEYPGSWLTFYPRMDGKWQLYDIQADRGELNDLSDKHPEKVRHLETLYQAWAKRSNVIDWDKLAGKKL